MRGYFSGFAANMCGSFIAINLQMAWRARVARKKVAHRKRVSDYIFLMMGGTIRGTKVKFNGITLFQSAWRARVARKKLAFQKMLAGLNGTSTLAVFAESGGEALHSYILAGCQKFSKKEEEEDDDEEEEDDDEAEDLLADVSLACETRATLGK